MSCRVLEGTEQGSDVTQACFFCSTTGTAFGPIMNDGDEANRFLAWLKADESRWSINSRHVPTCDPRVYSDGRLKHLYCEFCTHEETLTEEQIVELTEATY